jgi:type II secretory pathway component PulF
VLYSYSAYTLNEGVVRGRLEARSPADARLEITRRGFKPLKIQPVRRLPSKEALVPSLYGVKTGEIVRFSRQLAIMLASGGNLLNAMDMLRKETPNPVMKNTLAAIREALDLGEGLSAAMAHHPRVFSPLYVRVVEVGEHTGRLAPALEQLADMAEQENAAKQRAMRTLMYPIAIMGLSILTMAVLMVVAMPPLLKIFSSSGTKIPPVTRMVVDATSFMTAHAVQMILGTSIAGAALIILRRLPAVRLIMDTELVRLPVAGKFVVSSELSRIARTLTMLIEAGVPLATALRLATGGCSNLALKNAFGDAEASLMRGGGVAEALRKHPVLPSMFVELVMIGEQSNSLRRTMNEAAVAYQKQLEQGLDALLGILEPASTVVVGGIVALIAFAMFVPIYSGLDAVG